MTAALMGEQWYELLKEEMALPYFDKLKQDLRAEYNTTKVCPSPYDIFTAFKLTPPDRARVIILSQDPYPFNGHAHGLAFSSLQKETPPSLRFILREVDRDVVRTKNYQEFKQAFPTNDLSSWAKQGVFLLNTVLTVRAGEVGSHSKLGWQQFTSKVLQILADDPSPKIFVLWGAEARKAIVEVASHATVANHFILDSGHPASGTHGKDKFSGCSHFSKINLYLTKHGQAPIDWRTA